jgi:cytochrome c oxidase assembly protein subunit 15
MLIQLAIMGVLAALVPLSIVWVSADANKFRKLSSVTLFLTFDLIVFGAYTRLTDSGLGCPDWPGCYGHANPLQAHAMISAAETAMPFGPVTVFKAWIEMTHRYLAMGVGVLIVSLMVIAWIRWLKSARSDQRFAPTMPTLLFLFVCMQGAFGAFTVTMKLQPIIVTGHLLLGLGLLSMLTWLNARQRIHPPVAIQARTLRVPVLIASALLLVQLALGGWVSTNYAALACTDFPKCHGLWWPQMDFENGFALWRKLGMTVDGEYLPFPALTAIHFVHRSFAFVVFAVLGWVAWRATRIDGLRTMGLAVLAALLLQLCTGLATVYFNWPLAIAVMHNAGAALLVLLVTMLNYKIRLAHQGAPAFSTRTPPAS